MLALCRALIDAGYDPGRALLGHRGGNLALAVRSIGEGALLTVEDDRHGRPRLRRWRVRGRCGDDPPASKLEHVPPELIRQDSHGVLDRRFTGIDSPLGGGRYPLPILLIFEVG